MSEPEITIQIVWQLNHKKSAHISRIHEWIWRGVKCSACTTQRPKQAPQLWGGWKGTGLTVCKHTSLRSDSLRVSWVPSAPPGAAVTAGRSFPTSCQQPEHLEHRDGRDRCELMGTEAAEFLAAVCKLWPPPAPGGVLESSGEGGLLKPLTSKTCLGLSEIRISAAQSAAFVFVSGSPKASNRPGWTLQTRS